MEKMHKALFIGITLVAGCTSLFAAIHFMGVPFSKANKGPTQEGIAAALLLLIIVSFSVERIIFKIFESPMSPYEEHRINKEGEKRIPLFIFPLVFISYIPLLSTIALTNSGEARAAALFMPAVAMALIINGLFFKVFKKYVEVEKRIDPCESKITLDDFPVFAICFGGSGAVILISDQIWKLPSLSHLHKVTLCIGAVAITTTIAILIIQKFVLLKSNKEAFSAKGNFALTAILVPLISLIFLIVQILTTSRVSIGPLGIFVCGMGLSLLVTIAFHKINPFFQRFIITREQEE